MNKIKFVFFDVGNTLMIDKTDWDQFTEQLGPHASDLPKIMLELDKPLCLGEITVADAWDLYCDKFQFHKTYDEVKYLLELHGLEPITPMHELVYKVAELLPVGLLTNMYVNFLERFFDVKLIPEKKIFEKIVDSSLIHMTKPNVEIFDYATKMTNLMPQEIGFIDNNQANVEAAKNFGWNSWQLDEYNPEKSVKFIEKELINLIKV